MLKSFKRIPPKNDTVKCDRVLHVLEFNERIYVYKCGERFTYLICTKSVRLNVRVKQIGIGVELNHLPSFNFVKVTSQCSFFKIKTKKQ